MRGARRALRPIPRWAHVAIAGLALMLVVPVLVVASTVKLLEMAVTAALKTARKGGDGHVE